MLAVAEQFRSGMQRKGQQQEVEVEVGMPAEVVAGVHLGDQQDRLKSSPRQPEQSVAVAGRSSNPEAFAR